MDRYADRSRFLLMTGAILCTVLFAGFAMGCEGCLACVDEAQDQAEDNVARADYFESAAVTYYDGGRYDLAEGQFRKVLVIQPNNKKAKRGLAKSLYYQGGYPKLAEAQQIFEEIVNLEWPNPHGPGSRRYEVQTDLALTYSDIADLFDRDRVQLENKLRNDPNADPAKTNDWIQKQVARRNEYLAKAIPLLRQVLVASPDNPYALATLAKAHLQLGNDDLGIQFARRYLALSQQSQIGWKRKMQEWEDAVGGPGKVQAEHRNEFMMKIHGARDKEKKMHLMLASVYMRRQEFGAAVEEYSSVIKIDGAVPAAYVERAQAFGALQQYRRAVADLEEYLKITDPMMHREQRLNAVELLDRYQSAVRRAGAPPVRGS